MNPLRLDKEIIYQKDAAAFESLGGWVQSTSGVAQGTSSLSRNYPNNISQMCVTATKWYQSMFGIIMR